LPEVPEKLRFPQKADTNLWSRKDLWCEFHKGFEHSIEQCLVLGHQLIELLKEGFLKEYLEANPEEPQGEAISGEQTHEVPVNEELNTISGGFSGGGSIATKRKRYARVVMSLDMRSTDTSPEPDLSFKKSDLGDVVPHDNDPVVISVIMVGRRVHQVLIDQGNFADVMFWSTFGNLRISPRSVEATRWMLGRLCRGPSRGTRVRRG